MLLKDSSWNEDNGLGAVESADLIGIKLSELENLAGRV
jgi:hypothetical protein